MSKAIFGYAVNKYIAYAVGSNDLYGRTFAKEIRQVSQCWQAGEHHERV